MSTIKANGIVINEVNVGESDKILTILLKGIGKVAVSAKGARNTKSKFLSGTQLFCYSEFVIFTGRKYYSLVSAELIESFYNIRCEYEKLCYGSYFLEMAYKIILENEPCNEVIILLLKALSNLKKDDANNMLICNIFEFKILQILGYQPAISFCASCNKEHQLFGIKTYFGAEGIICSNCQNVYNKKTLINNTIVYVLSYIFEHNTASVFNFTIPDKDIILLDKCSKMFIRENIDAKFISLDNKI